MLDGGRTKTMLAGDDNEWLGIRRGNQTGIGCMTSFLLQPASTETVGSFLKAQLLSGDWTDFKAAVAFVRASGVDHLRDAIAQFSRTATAAVVVGVDLRGTSVEGLSGLLASVGRRGAVFAFHNESSSTFHPKLYIFRNSSRAEVLVGSNNLTEGGLFTNYEAAAVVRLDLADPQHAEALNQLDADMASWMDDQTPYSMRLDRRQLTELEAQGYIVRESERGASPATPPRTPTAGTERAALFGSHQFRAPARRRVQDTAGEAPTGPAGPTNRGFVMTLQRTDVGIGQVTPGASRRSPEVFIPLAARDYSPSFWGWPALFVPDPSRTGKLDRTGVAFRLGTATVHVNMMTWPVKHDFRLRSEPLRSAGNIGDILRLEMAPSGAPYDYYAEVVPLGTSLHSFFLALCSEAVRNSQKRWGYY